MAQGAKPVRAAAPGHKVDPVIAKVLATRPRVTLISPPPHHDIYCIEDLAQLIFDLKNVKPRARLVKLVAEVGVGTVAMLVSRRRARTIVLISGDGGHRRLAALVDQARGRTLGSSVSPRRSRC